MTSRSLGRKLVNFDEANTDGIVRAAHDCGVIAGRESAGNCRFVIVRWRETGGDDCRFLIRAPVVVESDERAGSIVSSSVGFCSAPATPCAVKDGPSARTMMLRD